MSAKLRAGGAAVAAFAALLLAAVASASPPETARDLAGRLTLEIARCRPIGRADALLEAEVVLRAGKTAVDAPALFCAAYDDEGAPFYLTPVAGRLSLRARETQRLTVRFAADGAHRACGCTVRDPGARPVSAGPENTGTQLAAREGATLRDRKPQAASAATGAVNPRVEHAMSSAGAASDAAADVAAGPTPAAPHALRYERVLAPRLALRAEPSARAAITGEAPAGARIAVDRIERGWKRARTADGRAGWLPSDAATADIGAPERVSELLAPLHDAPLAGAGGETPCASVERAALGELVAAWRVHERAVYVRPLWYALVAEDQRAFRDWAESCYSATRVIDAMTALEIRREDRASAR
jgi:hypothetical protein